MTTSVTTNPVLDAGLCLGNKQGIVFAIPEANLDIDGAESVRLVELPEPHSICLVIGGNREMQRLCHVAFPQMMEALGEDRLPKLRDYTNALIAALEQSSALGGTSKSDDFKRQAMAHTRYVVDEICRHAYDAETNPSPHDSGFSAALRKTAECVTVEQSFGSICLSTIFLRQVFPGIVETCASDHVKAMGLTDSEIGLFEETIYRKIMTPSFTSDPLKILVGGFGLDDPYPAMEKLYVDGFIDDRLKYEISPADAITEENPVLIGVLGDFQAVETLLALVKDETGKPVSSMIGDAFHGAAHTIAATFDFSPTETRKLDRIMAEAAVTCSQSVKALKSSSRTAMLRSVATDISISELASVAADAIRVPALRHRLLNANQDNVSQVRLSMITAAGPRPPQQRFAR